MNKYQKLRDFHFSTGSCISRLRTHKINDNPYIKGVVITKFGIAWVYAQWEKYMTIVRIDFVINGKCYVREFNLKGVPTYRGLAMLANKYVKEIHEVYGI